jgi:hypothetical protein
MNSSSRRQLRLKQQRHSLEEVKGEILERLRYGISVGESFEKDDDKMVKSDRCIMPTETLDKRSRATIHKTLHLPSLHYFHYITFTDQHKLPPSLPHPPAVLSLSFTYSVCLPREGQHNRIPNHTDRKTDGWTEDRMFSLFARIDRVYARACKHCTSSEHACMRACACACVRACMRACVSQFSSRVRVHTRHTDSTWVVSSRAESMCVASRSESESMPPQSRASRPLRRQNGAAGPRVQKDAAPKRRNSRQKPLT